MAPSDGGTIISSSNRPIRIYLRLTDFWSFWFSPKHVSIQEILFYETLENMGQHHGVLWHLDSASFHPGLSKWQLLVDLNTAPKGPPLLELPMGKQHHGLGWSPFVKSDAIACWITWPRRVVTTFIICMIWLRLKSSVCSNSLTTERIMVRTTGYLRQTC